MPKSDGNCSAEESFDAMRRNIEDCLRAYCRGTDVTTNGKVVLNDVKDIMASYGLPSKVRHSVYGKRQKYTVLDTAYLICSVKESECPFKLVLKAPPEENLSSEGESNRKSIRCYTFRIEMWHNHEHSEFALRETLTASIWNEALLMRGKSLIPSTKVIRYLQDKYGLCISREVIIRKMRNEMRKLFPPQKDCGALVSSLVNMRDESPGMFLKVRETHDSALNAICWGKREWLYD